MGASPEPVGVCSAVRCLFREWPEEGEGGKFDLGLEIVAAVRLAGRRAQNN